ncbi:hypothetical protein AWH62_06520 [Maricaulis sp. W15]|uniref:LytTr DNA-binding domain-containing protein n=1 Tax=Maricaulis maris TaxID=74318 RepID=A0A495D4C8_9PROT|nr:MULTISPECIES: LytTR family DNA-binding domain-containing protein [Maricaulis]OLF75465.1 hypothetical protein AWH62_06520 [Maricaulis sp. W15]RKQ96764.1 LytTr DNA-binding domain-containing protein [Maricaulis maris]
MSGPDVNRPNLPLPAIMQAACLALGIVVLAALFSAAGAYDTDELGVGHRFFLWLIVASLMLLQPWLIEYGLSRLVPRTRAWKLVCSGLAVVLCTLALTLELHALKFTPILPKAPDPLVEFFVFLAPAAMPVAALVLVLKFAVAGRALLAGPVDGGPGLLMDPDIPGLNAAWPNEPLLYVRAEDHYLEIRTGQARLFVRGRLSDALLRLEGKDGLQVHRSWWIADDAVATVKRVGRDLRITLQTGERVPVARPRAEAVKARGWLARIPADAPTAKS